MTDERQGALFGFLLYGTVDLTNCALIQNWSWRVTGGWVGVPEEAGGLMSAKTRNPSADHTDNQLDHTTK
jgi:hypothetical protein